MTASAHRGRRDNGLNCNEFLPVADIDPRLTGHLLDVLGLREVAAYVEPAPAQQPIAADRLYVAAHLITQARATLGDVANELGIAIVASPAAAATRPRPTPDPLAGHDTESEFAAIVSGLGELAGFDPKRQQIEPEPGTDAVPPGHGGPAGPRSWFVEDEIEHFEPPPAPPLPRLRPATLVAVLIAVVGIAALAFGSMVGMPPDLPLPLGIALVLIGAGLLFRQLHAEPRDDSDGNGAVV